MNRRELLKALIASPIAAAAGASIVKAADPVPVVAPLPIEPTGSFTIFESPFRSPECSYTTLRSNAPALGSWVSVERNGEVVFSGVVESLQEFGDKVDVHAKAEPLNEKELREIYDEEYGLPMSITAVNFPAVSPRR